LPDLFIGLMSGTSMDSIDAILADFSSNPPSLIDQLSVPLDSELRADLLALCEKQEEPLLGQCDHLLAELFSDAVKQLLSRNNLQPQDIQAIGSHGQTIFHQPPENGENGYSLQIANPSTIAKLTQIQTVGDFRNNDMRVGGQGAPLAPAFHKAVFSHPEKDRVVVNIGGIGNITALSKTGPVIGFDTGPGNVLMDYWINKQLGKSFDESGAWAAQGNVLPELLALFQQEPYLNEKPPKSTGRELFNSRWLEEKLDRFAENNDRYSESDIQSTLCAFTAQTISDHIERFAPQTKEVFVCGGGAFNNTLMAMLQEYSGLPVESTLNLGIDPCWVEGLAFAWLAKRTLEGKPGNLPEVTGASESVVLGEVFQP